MASQAGGYLAVLRDSQPFRRLWYGQVASQLGDWLDTIALYTLVLRLTGSATAVAGLLIAQALPSVLVGLWAGVVIDRLPRRAVLIAADLGRAALVLLFLVVREPGQVWLVYAVTFGKFTLTAFYEPAREALVPDVVPRERLVAANGLSGLTWSVMLTGGAALGGLVAGNLGTDVAFLLDSVSFVVSAAFTVAVVVTESHLTVKRRAHPLLELREGIVYLLRRRDVTLYALSKTFWSLGGGCVLVLLPLFGQKVFPLGRDGALSMGLLYAARGVGAGVGPLLAMRVGGGSALSLRRALGLGFLVMGLGYLLFAGAPGLALAACALVVAHCGGSVQWVFSTALLQLSVPGRLQGRVFAVEWTLLTLAICVGSYAAGAAADAGWSPRALALAGGLAFVPPGILLIVLLWPAPVAGEEIATPEGVAEGS
jgi:MFS family permease